MPISTSPKPIVGPHDINIARFADAEGSEGGTTYTKHKEIQIGIKGIYRIKFDLRIALAANNAYGQIYKNGAAFGTERINSTTSYVNYTEDLSFVEGDLLQLYIKVASSTAWYRNFRAYGDLGPGGVFLDT